MKNHTIKAYLDAMQRRAPMAGYKRPVAMKAPKPLRDTIARIETKRGVTLAKEMV